MSTMPSTIAAEQVALPALSARRWRTAVVAVAVSAVGGVAALLAMDRLPATVPLWRISARAHDPGMEVARAQAVARARARVTAQRVPTPPAAVVRVGDASRAGDLFAAHSWYVPPPPPPPAAPALPPPPTAPAFPFVFVGSYAPAGDKPVYFLARGDRVLEVHVGDRVDGVYEFESADRGQLVFNYLPLNVRQPLPTGATP